MISSQKLALPPPAWQQFYLDLFLLPHPNAFAATNLGEADYPEEPCWRHIVVPSLRCVDAATCSMAAKAAKMPLAAPPELLGALRSYARVLYLDDKVVIDDAAALARLAAHMTPARDWALLIRAHEGDTDGHRGVDAELRAALWQPRYRSREARSGAPLPGQRAWRCRRFHYLCHWFHYL